MNLRSLLNCRGPGIIKQIGDGEDSRSGPAPDRAHTLTAPCLTYCEVLIYFKTGMWKWDGFEGPKCIPGMNKATAF